MKYKAVCHYCKQPMDPVEPGTYHSIQGWVQKRRGGGVHAVKMQRSGGEYMHMMCMNAYERGWKPEHKQEELI